MTQPSPEGLGGLTPKFRWEAFDAAQEPLLTAIDLQEGAYWINHFHHFDKQLRADEFQPRIQTGLRTTSITMPIRRSVGTSFITRK
ncbi:protein of unknown function [Methylocella tundrae]|uniref:Uncharacterized protein n=1 Tax=Methylocella tundrae TaxID=227605 RepID=A0A4U8Z3E5_METTU|nr:protein of unknown function [Methylocella tundrae]